jgi:hypothetical protein
MAAGLGCASAIALMIAWACGGGDSSTSPPPGPTDVATDCRTYCQAQDRAGCILMVPLDQCVTGCTKVVEAYGACGDAWRTTMRCISGVGLTCGPNGPRPNGCGAEYVQFNDCLQTHSDGGIDARGDEP